LAVNPVGGEEIASDEEESGGEDFERGMQVKKRKMVQQSLSERAS
jgi:hypothetical protein